MPTRERIEDTVEPPPETSERQVLVVGSLQMEDVGLHSYEPLVDEPVTGSGNDDLWEPGCETGEPGACVQQSAQQDSPPGAAPP